VLDDEPSYDPIRGHQKDHKLIGIIRGINTHEKYIEYKRKEKKLFDVLANIVALSMLVYRSFVLIFGFTYSQNFDNYKIIDNILSTKFDKNDKKHIKDLNEVKLNKDFNKKEEFLIYNINNELNENDLILDDIDYEKEKINEDNKAHNNNNNNESFIKMPKLHFWDFLLNNIYFKKLWKSDKQELISISSEIIEKYYSLENILYNQIKLENLLKDYKWNTQNLNCLIENELINKLKLNIQS